MSQLENLVKLAEDELLEYSTKARKIEKLRRKIGLSVTKEQRQTAQAELLKEMELNVFNNGINKLIAEQRQAVALPFWGIAGLGLLISISFNEPLGLLAAGGGAFGAITLQKLGWKLQAKVLLLETFVEIEALSKQ